MNATRALRSKLKQVVRSPLPESVLQSQLVRRMAKQTSNALGRLSDAFEKADALKVAHTHLGRSAAVAEIRNRLGEMRSELRKLVRPRPSPAPAPEAKRQTDKPMPEMIHTSSGGKRLPAAIAQRAIRKSSNEFRPKKGQKKH